MENELENYVLSEKKKSEDLIRKLNMTETRIADLMEQLLDSRKFSTGLENELQATKNKIAATVAAKCTLELTQDELLNKVRVLEASLDELNGKHESLHESNVFLESDIELLNEKLKELEEEKRIITLERDMYQKQTTELRMQMDQLKSCQVETQGNEREVFSPIVSTVETPPGLSTSNNDSSNVSAKSNNNACCIIQ